MPESRLLQRKLVGWLLKACSYCCQHLNAGIEPHQISADGWAIGWDERFPQSQRLQQALVFARFSQHDNLYAHPLVGIFSFSRDFLSTTRAGLHPCCRRDCRQGCPH